MVFAVFMLIILWGGYWLLAPRLEQKTDIDIHHQPAELSWKNTENFRFLSYKQAQVAQIGVLTSIQAFFGAITGIFYGPWQMLWMVGGTLLFGAVVNYYAGIYSVSHNGKTWLCWLKEQKPRLYLPACIFLLTVMIIGAAGTCLVTYYISFAAQSFTPVIYIYFAIMLLIAFCSQNKFNIFAVFTGGLFILTTFYFTVFSLPVLSNVMFSFDFAVYPQIKFAYPMLFFTVCSGVLSGTEALKCCLLAPAVKNEKFAKGIYFGSSIFLTGLLILWVLVLLAWNPDITILSQALYKFEYPYELIESILLWHFNWFAFGLFYVTLVCLCIGSGATLLRVARQLVAESGMLKQISSEYALIVFFVIAMVLYAFSFGTTYFEILNMLTACLWLYFIGKMFSHLRIYWAVIFFLFGLCVSQLLLVKLQTSLMMAVSGGLGSFVLCACGYYLYLKRLKK